MLYTRRWIKLIRYIYNAAKTIRAIPSKATVYAHWWIPLAWLATQSGATVNVHVHGGDVAWLEHHRIVAWCLRRYTRRVNHWTFVSRSLRQRFMRLYSFVDVAKTSVEPMVANKEIFTNQNLPRLKSSFVVCGALVPRKNVDLAIWYVRNEDIKTGARHPLIIIGDGHSRKALEILAYNLRVDARFMGKLPQSQVADHFNRCETFLSFSVEEGYGLTVDEAKLCGCKTIVSDGDGKAEHADVILPIPNRRKLKRILNSYHPWESLSDIEIGDETTY